MAATVLYCGDGNDDDWQAKRGAADVIRVGLVGYGYASRTFHQPFLEASPRYTVVAASTTREAGEAARHWRIYRSATTLIRDAEVDLVIVTTPNDTHFELAVLGLEAGRHVVLDKPMATSTTQAEALVTLAREKSRVLSVFHNRRWDGDFLTVQTLLDRQALGELRHFESHFDRYRPQVQARWREQPGAGTGLWWDLGPHLLDQALCLFGDPEALTARILVQRPGGVVPDYFHVQLHYPALEVLLHASSLAAAPNVRFRLQGTAGSYLKHGLDPQETQLRQGLSPGDTEFGIEPAADAGWFHGADDSRRVATLPGAYGHYFEALADAIKSGGPAPVDGADGARVVRFLELGEASQATGRTVSRDRPGG